MAHTFHHRRNGGQVRRHPAGHDRKAERITPGMHAASYQCAGCFEWIETTVDESGGSRQQYVEDCQVCCKPNVLTVLWDRSAGEYTITAELES